MTKQNKRKANVVELNPVDSDILEMPSTTRRVPKDEDAPSHWVTHNEHRIKTGLDMEEKARKFAAERHEGQYRESNSMLPLLDHLQQTVNAFHRYAHDNSPLLRVGAWLHDTLENTDTTGKELDKEFGPEVHWMVAQASCDKTLNQKDRLRRLLERAPLISEDAASLKMAEMIANLEEIQRTPKRRLPPELRARYEAFTLAMLGRLKGGDLGLRKRAAGLLIA